MIFSKEESAHNADRTRDLFLTKEVLYRLSYVGAQEVWFSKKTKADNGTWTHNLQITNQLLYQLSYVSTKFFLWRISLLQVMQ